MKKARKKKFATKISSMQLTLMFEARDVDFGFHSKRNPSTKETVRQL